jgi:hypothetical protein
MSVRDCVLGSGIVPVVCPVGANSGNPCLTPRSADLLLAQLIGREQRCRACTTGGRLLRYGGRWAEIGPNCGFTGPRESSPSHEPF